MYKKKIDLRKKKKFEISVLFSFYNNQHTIKKSLKSILFQTHKNFEIIICSDGSTDKSDQIVKGLIHKSDNVLFIKSNKNNGLTKSLNYMMKFTSGDYLARHDADDISHIKRLQYQVNFLKVNKNINILGSNGIYYIKKKKKFIKMPSNNNSIKKNLISRNPIIHSSVIIKRKILLQNKYDQNFLRCQDYELWLRLRNKARYHNIQKYLVTRNIDGNRFNYQDLYFTVLARYKYTGLLNFVLYSIKDLIYFILRKIIL